MARNQKLDATITVGSVLQASVKRNFSVIQGGLDSVGSELREVTKRQREMSKQSAALRKAGQNVEHLDHEYAQLGRTLDELRRKQQRFERAQAAANRVGRDFARASRDIGRVARNASIAVGAIGAAAFGIASGTAELGDNVAKTADKLGFGVEAFQELRYAAERSGISISTFDSSMVAMQKRLGEAAQGTGVARKALDQLGLSASELIEVEPEEALARIAERMAGVENPAEQAALSAALFSRAGVGMINMLRDGSDGLWELREDARKTGYVLSERSARDAEVFQDSLLNAQLTTRGLKNTLGAELMPVVTEVMDDFTSYMRDNRAEVQGFAEDAAGALRDAIPVVKEVVSGLAGVAVKVGDITAQVADMVGGWENFGILIGGALLTKVMISVGRMIGSVGRFGFAVAGLVGKIGGIGTAMSGAATKTELAATRMNSAMSRIKFGAALAAMQTALAINNMPEDLKEREAWQKKNAEGMESRLRNTPIVGGAMRTYEGVRDWYHDDTGDTPPLAFPSNHPMAQKRAVGGAFAPGPLLVGERGPERMWADRAGYVENNRSLERAARLAARARAGLSESLSGGLRSGGATTINVTINALGTSAREVIQEIERIQRRAASGALFDGPTTWGQYG